jgi:ferredoxin
MNFRYLKDVVTLELDSAKCTGCGMCTKVCGHAVLALNGNLVEVLDRDGCMECGACAMNCPVEAVTVRPGVGCAWAIFTDWVKRTEVSEHSCD